MLPKLLIVIPHYYGPATTRTSHGSTSNDAARRAAIVARTIMAIHQTFGSDQYIMQLEKRATDPANEATRFDVRIIVCVVANHHLLNGLNLSQRRFERRVCDVQPTSLGYACHDVLAENVEQADWFGYLEDDLIINDPLFFDKLAWFNSLTDDSAVLLPNRFERAENQLAAKAYVDGNLPFQSTAAFQEIQEKAMVSAFQLGREYEFIRPSNPHSGCFFLSKNQLKAFVDSPNFHDRTAEFIGPLESAASLNLMRTFRVYKPAVRTASFLEIEHQSNQFISMLRRPEQ